MMKQWFVKYFGIALVALIGLSDWATAQNVEAVSSISADTILPGQQITYEINLKAPEGYLVEWPLWEDTLSKEVEIIRHKDVEQLPLDDKGNVWMRQQLTVTSFDTGVIRIPPIALHFSPKGDTSKYEALSNGLFLRVIPVAIDTSAAFKPIKGIQKAPLTFMEILPWIIGFLGVALIALFLVWYFVKRQRRTTEMPLFEKPKRPPHLTAIEALENLRHERLWQNGKVKEYYSQLTDIVRLYIEQQFHVLAVEMTTDEILSGLKHFSINPEAMQKLSGTLQIADLVKFAKAQPTALENDLSLDHMLDFVKESYGNGQPAEAAFSEENQDKS